METGPIVYVDTNRGEQGVGAVLRSILSEDHVISKKQDVGDYLIVHNDTRVCVERKAWDDFRNSVVSDKRYVEQKLRQGLIANQGVRMVYIIEGELQFWHKETRGVPNKNLEAAIIKSELRDGIHIFRSKDVEHTAHIIAYIFSAMKSGKLSFQTKQMTNIDYAAFVKGPKKGDNVDEKTTWLTMLQTIPGVSPEKARKIAEEFPTPKSMVDGIDSDRLTSMQCGKRKLGPILANKIAKMFK